METWPVHMGESRRKRGESRCQVEESPCWTGMEGLEARRMDLSYPPSFRVSVCQCSYPLLKRTFSDVEGVSECRETASCHLFPPASGARFFPRLLLTCLFQHWRYGAWGLPGKCSASEPHPDRALRSVLCGFTLNN